MPEEDVNSGEKSSTPETSKGKKSRSDKAVMSSSEATQTAKTNEENEQSCGQSNSHGCRRPSSNSENLEVNGYNLSEYAHSGEKSHTVKNYQSEKSTNDEPVTSTREATRTYKNKEGNEEAGSPTSPVCTSSNNDNMAINDANSLEDEPTVAPSEEQLTSNANFPSY